MCAYGSFVVILSYNYIKGRIGLPRSRYYLIILQGNQLLLSIYLFTLDTMFLGVINIFINMFTFINIRLVCMGLLKFTNVNTNTSYEF